MRIDLFLLTKLILSFNTGSSAKTGLPSKKRGARIIIEVEFSKGMEKKITYLESAPLYYVVNPSWRAKKPTIRNNVAKWTLFSDSALVVNLTPILGLGNKLHLYEPGDSIRIDLKNGQPVYSGNNAEKFRMLQEINRRELLLPTPPSDPKKLFFVNSLHDYLEWHRYLNTKLDLLQTVFESYKERIKPFAYNYLRAGIITEIEYTRMMKFGALRNASKEFGISGESLGKIFDSTANNEYTKWLHSYKGRVPRYYSYFYDYVRKSVERRYNFDTEHDSLSSARRKMLYAELAKKTYKGDVLQSCLVFLLTEQGLKEHTYKHYSPEIDTLLVDFYAQPGYPEHKKYVREYAQKIGGWITTKGAIAPDFVLRDQKGNLVNKQQFEGKIVLLNFIHPNCRECLHMNNEFLKLQRLFKENPNISFLSVVVNKDKQVVSPKTLNQSSHSEKVTSLYTEANEKGYSTVKNYNVQSFPQIFMIDAQGKFVYSGSPSNREHLNNTIPDPRKDKEHKLLGKIHEQLALINDGPYVMHRNDSFSVATVQGSYIKKEEYAQKDAILLNVQTDSYNKHFPVRLKKAHQPEPSIFTRPEKLFVLSDIEGNFTALKNLLQANNIIDKHFNWSYGRGHLVFAGDMFDRGKQVNECLWLIYSLEEKAKAAGGYIHFILGNHEIMNFNGDIRYVNEKYKTNALQLKTAYNNLYGESSELGTWLRTKNVMEKIGDLLFVHGGVSNEINNLNLSIETINRLSRCHYSSNSLEYICSDKMVPAIYDPATSPFWNRGYYLSDASKRTPESVVNNTLRKFNVSRIITGHTIVDKMISVHFNGKVINTDTNHANGESEALLIENNTYFRVNGQGKREILFNPGPPTVK